MKSEPAISIEFRPKAPGYWIRRYLPDREAFVLAPADGAGSEFLASIDFQTPARGRIREFLMESIFGNGRGTVPLRLLVRTRPVRPDRPGGGRDSRIEPLAAITDAFPVPRPHDSQSRNILGSDGQVVSRWTDGLEGAVDHHGQFFLARRVFEFLAGVDAGAYGKIRERAAAALGGTDRHLPPEYRVALRGEEEGRRCRYNPVLPLGIQVAEAPTPICLANYSFQRAIVEVFADQALAGVAVLAEAQEELLSEGALLAVPPARKADPMRERTRETARGIASLILAGLMELHGAEPASKECDELYGFQADGTLARRAGLHEEILREMAPHPVARSEDTEKKMVAYLEMARSRLARYEADARGLVAAEQAKATMGPKARASVPQEREAGLNGGKAILGIEGLIGIGGHAATVADLAHKLATQAETLPWI